MSEHQFSLDADQIAFREVIRKFAEEKIAPYAADSDHNSAYSWESFKALQQMELTALSYPVEYGGSGISNKKAIKIEKEPWNGRDFSSELTLPPLGVSVFKVSLK